MKILHIMDSAGLYGAEIMLLNLMEEQRRMNLSPILLSINDLEHSKSAIEVESRKRGFQTVKVPIASGYSLRGALDIVKAGRENDVTLFHSHGFKANILLGFLPKFIRNKPIVSTLHGYISVKFLSRMRIYEFMDALALRRIDAVVRVAASSRTDARYPSRRNTHNYIINNGIPELIFDSSSIHQSDSAVSAFCKDGFILGTICRLSEEKGVDYLVEAMRLLSDRNRTVKAIIIGEGPQRDSLQDKISLYGLNDRILLAGYKDQAYHYLPLFDAFVLPSLTEGLPITILEAMQAKVPVIATDVGGVPDVLGHGKFGILVRSADAPALAEAITEVSSGTSRMSTMCADAHATALERYSSKRMAENYLKVYETVLRKWGR